MAKKTTTQSTAKNEKEFEKNSKTTIADNVNTEPVLTKEEPVQKTAKKPELNNDVEQTKKYAWLAYILFFIPLLINSKSPFVRHHANEGLEINIFDAIAGILLVLGAVLPQNIEWVYLLAIIFTFIGFGLFTLTIITKIYMIYSTLQGKTKSTPWMWDLRIIR